MDFLFGRVAYTWDANGNLTSDGVRSYSYDYADRLTQVVSGTFTTQYAYNGDGVRTSKTVGGATAEYVLDLAATLPVVISDTDAVYLYGLDIIAQQQAQTLYYMHDGLGSVRQLVDTNGEVQTSYAYDPFCVPLAGGDVYNAYQYTGEAWDAELELLYLRARYYQPEVGRFITRDPWRGHSWEPGTLNRYTYVRNRPVNSSDPTGLQEGAYSSYESYEQARQLVADWFFQQGDVVQYFGPNEPLTQDVRYSQGVRDFKELWGQRAQYFVPLWWIGQSIDQREGPLYERLRQAWPTFVRAQWYLFECSIGLGSQSPEGPIDPVVGVLGSFKAISVGLESHEALEFRVYNIMGRASASRLLGTKIHLLENVLREKSGGWGGTIHQVFFWYEPTADYPQLRVDPGYAEHLEDVLRVRESAWRYY